jgi:tetratricopeptide (TPR) repeat protein
MDCVRVAREEILEHYLLDRLDAEDRDAFEEHYFECARCFDDLRTLQALKQELSRAGGGLETATTRSAWRWAPAAGLAAAVLLTVGVLLWMRPPVPPGSLETSDAQPTSSAQSLQKPPPREPAPKARSEASLLELARVEPPRYEPRTLRGAPDEATARFQRGMEQYRKGDYAAAVADLRAAAELDPDAAHVRFFLGISYLMLGQDHAAIDSLRAVIAHGDSAYLEDAYLYLAKAFLRRKDFRAADTQLKKLIQLRGPRSGEGRRLLTEMEKLKDRSP